MINSGCVVHILLVLSMVLSVDASQAQSAKKPTRVKEPAWFVAPPMDSENLIARGKVEASDMQVALDQALAVARGELAVQCESSWQRFLEALRKEMPNCGIPLKARAEVVLTGTTILRQKTMKRRKMYTAFVLVSWPSASLDAALLTRAKEDTGWYDGVKGTSLVRRLEKKR